MQLADLTWPEVHERAAAGAVLAVPLGSTEQHGPHLPFTTDTDVAVALCAALADARPDVVVAPGLPYGSSGEHQGFAGTLSIGQAALEHVLVELGRSAGETFAHVVLVSGHGGNAEPVARAVATLQGESRDVHAYFPHWDGDPHAGHVETSLLLRLRPDAVRMTHAVPGDPRPLADVLPLLRAGGVAAVSATGVLGDPTTASADAGVTLLAELSADLVAFAAELFPARGRPSASEPVARGETPVVLPDGGRSRGSEPVARGETSVAADGGSP